MKKRTYIRPYFEFADIEEDDMIITASPWKETNTTVNTYNGGIWDDGINEDIIFVTDENNISLPD